MGGLKSAFLPFSICNMSRLPTNRLCKKKLTACKFLRLQNWTDKSEVCAILFAFLPDDNDTT